MIPVLDCAEIRPFVKGRGILMRKGYRADAAPVVECSKLIDRYLYHVGLPTYLSQMLGRLATVSMYRCMLGWLDGRILVGRICEHPRMQAQQFLKYKVGIKDLPYVVEVTLEEGLVVARYV